MVEAREAAGNDRAGRRKSQQPSAHFFQRHAGFAGDLDVESLTVFPQASKHFDQCAFLAICRAKAR
jgi:hypothetical protein